MVAPLLFSFADQEAPATLTLRVGKYLHKDGTPHWCKALVLQNGTKVRKLNIALPNFRPEQVYTVGIEIKPGKGRYRDTRMVTISPQFIVDNRCSGKLKISQRAYATSFFDAEAQATHLDLPPSCNLPFHWPRLDKEQLLCVKLVEMDRCHWSGGFPIGAVDSFHINIR